MNVRNEDKNTFHLIKKSKSIEKYNEKELWRTFILLIFLLLTNYLKGESAATLERAQYGCKGIVWHGEEFRGRIGVFSAGTLRCLN